MGTENKSRLLNLYQILVQHSDIDAPLSTMQIIQLLHSEFGIDTNRVTLGNDLKVLCNSDLNIHCVRSSQNKYYYDNQLFEISEIKILIDAVSSAKFISQQKSDKVIEKLLKLANERENRILRRHIYSSQRVKSDHSAGYYNVDTINSAIDCGKKITFQYYDYDVHKNRILKHNGKDYILSPYSLIWDGDYYYVIGCDSDGSLRTYRLDRIVPCPTILEEDALPYPETFNLAEYSRAVFRMYSTDAPQNVTLLCEQYVMKALIDNFGTEVATTPVDGQHFLATVCVCTSPTFYRWVFGWNGAVKIISPEETICSYKQMIQNAMV